MIIFVAVLHFVNMFKNHTDLEILIYFHSDRNISSFPLQTLYTFLNWQELFFVFQSEKFVNTDWPQEKSPARRDWSTKAPPLMYVPQGRSLPSPNSVCVGGGQSESPKKLVQGNIKFNFFYHSYFEKPKIICLINPLEIYLKKKKESCWNFQIWTHVWTLFLL